MALSIKNDKADRLARELAELTGESLTDAVVISLEERLERKRAEDPDRDLVDRIMAIAEHASKLPVYDTRSAKEIMDDMYDEDGLPK